MGGDAYSTFMLGSAAQSHYSARLLCLGWQAHLVV
jgi:hypothetical protein